MDNPYTKIIDSLVEDGEHTSQELSGQICFALGVADLFPRDDALQLPKAIQEKLQNKVYDCDLHIEDFAGKDLSGEALYAKEKEIVTKLEILIRQPQAIDSVQRTPKQTMVDQRLWLVDQSQAGKNLINSGITVRLGFEDLKIQDKTIRQKLVIHVDARDALRTKTKHETGPRARMV